ncbi:MAG: hypothetical protein JNM85_00560 [Chthonomonas sp.]|nr:hypothetical protein [Chthonomonas sp.]
MFRINTNVQAMNALRNLANTSASANNTMTRLSSGLRINSAADDPAGLQISEGLRAQLGGIDQALRNNQDAVNFAKTAEGALAEVNQLLNDARALAVANSNDATLSTSQKQANQNQLNSILSSIDRISTNTQYGSKKLLNGSAGITANVVNAARLQSVQIGGTFGSAQTSVTANDTLNVNVATAAVKATVTGGAAVAANAVGADGNLAINGINFKVNASMTNQQLVDAVNSRSEDTGVQVAITGGNMVFTATNYGTGSNSIQITNDTAGLGFAAVGTRTLGSGTAGVNAVATFTLATAGTTTGALTASTADGKTFNDASGNVFKLTDVGATTTGALTSIASIAAGSAQFQIGANQGQTASLSLANTSAATLGVSGLDITTVSGASTALTSIDSAITSVGSSRGSIGNFVRNVLESNTRSLSIAKENLSAADSAVRDADVAEEMTKFTKLQIMQQSGLSMLAQANSASQSVLALLRG